MLSNHLIVRLPAIDISEQTRVDWQLFSPALDTLGSGDTELAQLVDQVRDITDDFTVVAIAPGESALLSPVVIPARNLRQLRQALPFMVEELIAEDIENVHMALPDDLDLDDDAISVAVIRHEVLINWLDCFHRCHLPPEAIHLDCLSIPVAANQWTVFVETPGRVLIRTGQYSAYVANNSDCRLLLESLLAGLSASAPSPLIKVVHVEADGNARLAAELVSFLKDKDETLEVQQAYFQEPATQIIAAVSLDQLINDDAINLLQGGYSVTAEHDSGWSQWRIPALVTGTVLGFYVMILLLSGWYFNHRADQLDREAVALYRDLFPGERRVVSPRKQMLNNLQRSAQQGSGDTLLALLAMSADQLGGGEQLDLQQLRFNGDNGALQLEVSTASIGNLEQFKQTLAGRGMGVNIRSAVEQGDAVTARLEIRQQ